MWHRKGREVWHRKGREVWHPSEMWYRRECRVSLAQVRLRNRSRYHRRDPSCRRWKERHREGMFCKGLCCESGKVKGGAWIAVLGLPWRGNQIQWLHQTSGVRRDRRAISDELLDLGNGERRVRWRRLKLAWCAETAGQVVCGTVSVGGWFEVSLCPEEVVEEMYSLVKVSGARSGSLGREASLWTKPFETKAHV